MASVPSDSVALEPSEAASPAAPHSRGNPDNPEWRYTVVDPAMDSHNASFFKPEVKRCIYYHLFTFIKKNCTASGGVRSGMRLPRSYGSLLLCTGENRTLVGERVAPRVRQANEGARHPASHGGRGDSHLAGAAPARGRTGDP
jgi:hypothetical protein